MDFFDHQDNARKQTRYLILMMCVTTLCIVFIISFVVIIAIHLFSEANNEASYVLDINNIPVEKWLLIPVGTALVIFSVSFIQYRMLRNGGKALVKQVGAKEITNETQNPQEIRLIHIVEEMALASGIPVPATYVIDEEGINAFVAGFKPCNAVLVVSKGALEHLTRDEMQGVIGHEYSHIFNNDIIINIRLMAITSGILLIHNIGKFILEIGAPVRRRAHLTASLSSRRSGKARAIIMLVAIAFFVVGYIGVFFSRLIKASVSRKREYLADASAVQFTRNPEGIAGALIKIKLFGSKLLSRSSEDISHFCIGETVHFGINALSTHPPITKRIRALDPSGEIEKKVLQKIKQEQQKKQSPEPEKKQKEQPDIQTMTAFAAAGMLCQTNQKMDRTKDNIAQLVGTVTPDDLDYAKKLYKNIPESINTALRNADEVVLVIYGLILSLDKLKGAHSALLSNFLEKKLADHVIEISKTFSSLDPQIRMAVVDLATPILKRKPLNERNKFLKQIKTLSEHDQSTSIFEWSLIMVFYHRLKPKDDQADKIKYTKFSHVKDAICTVIKGILIGTHQKQGAMAYQTILSEMFKEVGFQAFDEVKVSHSSLSKAIWRLQESSPKIKRRIISACTDAVLFDEKVTISEMELLRAIATNLDCPMPRVIFNHLCSGES